MQICSPTPQKAAFRPASPVSTSVRGTAPIIVLYEALQTATSPVAEASPMGKNSFKMSLSELQGAVALPQAARPKSFATRAYESGQAVLGRDFGKSKEKSGTWDITPQLRPFPLSV